MILKMDKVIDDWGKGKISNAQLRAGIKSLGGEILNPRITSSMAADSLEVAMPSGRIRSFNKGGLARKKKRK